MEETLGMQCTAKPSASAIHLLFFQTFVSRARRIDHTQRPQNFDGHESPIHQNVNTMSFRHVVICARKGAGGNDRIYYRNVTIILNTEGNACKSNVPSNWATGWPIVAVSRPPEHQVPTVDHYRL